MKIVGIIGGFGPESTVEYYRSIIASYRQQKQDGSYPSIIINSIELKTVMDLIRANELTNLADYLLNELRRVERAGVDFALFAANLLHIVFDEVRSQSPLPLISIVEAAADEAKKSRLKRVGLLGARFTMQGQFYPDVFSKEVITIITPNEEEQSYIHDKYMGELVIGIYSPETKERILAIVEELKERENIDGVILGGTELPLLLRSSEYKGIPFLDTTGIHVNKIVARLLSGDNPKN